MTSHSTSLIVHPSGVHQYPSNIVVVFSLNGSLPIETLHVCQPILVVPSQNLKTRGRRRLAYCGHEGAIVSLRYKNSSRGLRSDGGVMGSFAEIDLQLNRTNIHLKVSPSKITVMGVLEEEVAQRAVDSLLNLFDWTFENLRSLSIEAQQLDWMVQRVSSHDFQDSISLVELEDFALSQGWSLSTTRFIYSHLIEMTSLEAWQLRVEQLKMAIQDLRLNPAIYTEVPKCLNYRIANSTYAFKVCDLDHPDRKLDFVLRDLCCRIILLNRGSVSASFHSWIAKHIKIVITFEDPITGALIEHRFNLTPEGGVRQWCPDVKETAWVVQDYFLEILNQALSSDFGPNLTAAIEEVASEVAL